MPAITCYFRKAWWNNLEKTFEMILGPKMPYLLLGTARIFFKKWASSLLFIYWSTTSNMKSERVMGSSKQKGITEGQTGWWRDRQTERQTEQS